MTRITVDETLRTKLHGLSEPLELCDEAGHVVAHLLPATGPLESNLEPKISREELQRRRTSPGKTYTTAEVLAYLEKL